jgi:hypothetical protein
MQICTLQLSKDCWGERRDLNPRPSVPQTDALPAELRSPPGEYYSTTVDWGTTFAEPRIRGETTPSVSKACGASRACHDVTDGHLAGLSGRAPTEELGRRFPQAKLQEIKATR